MIGNDWDIILKEEMEKFSLGNNLVKGKKRTDPVWPQKTWQNGYLEVY